MCDRQIADLPINQLAGAWLNPLEAASTVSPHEPTILALTKFILMPRAHPKVETKNKNNLHQNNRNDRPDELKKTPRQTVF